MNKSDDSKNKIHYFNKKDSKHKIEKKYNFDSFADDFERMGVKHWQPENNNKAKKISSEKLIFGELKWAFEVFFRDIALESKKNIGENIITEVRELLWNCEEVLKKLSSKLSFLEYKFMKLLSESIFYDRILPEEEEKQKKMDKFLEEIFFKEDKNIVWFNNFLNDFFSSNSNPNFFNFNYSEPKNYRLRKIKQELYKIGDEAFTNINDKSRKLSKHEKEFLYKNLRSDGSIARLLRHEEIKRLITNGLLMDIVELSSRFRLSELIARQIELFIEEKINLESLMILLEDKDQEKNNKNILKENKFNENTFPTPIINISKESKEQRKQKSSDRQVKELKQIVLPSINKKD